MNSLYNWIVVGAGFTGATLARLIAEQTTQRVLLIDRRNHIGGNAFDYYDSNGVLVHAYGPHIFHTNSRRIFDFVSRFTEWRFYSHHAQVMVDGRPVPLPFNLNALHALFPRRMAERFEIKLIAQFGFGGRVPVLTLRECGDADLRFLADYVYNKVFKDYTRKQWDMAPEELSPYVTARVPIVVSRDDRHFTDRFQAVPQHSYTRLFERMLAHPKIQVLLQADFSEIRGALDNSTRIIYCGPIDAYFEYKHGALPFRSLRFEHRCTRHAIEDSVGTINYPSNNDLTRVTNMAVLTGQDIGRTVLTAEYPQPYQAGINEPLYPVLTGSSQQLLAKYQAEADLEAGRVWFAGRLGDYQYYNMDQAVGRAMALFEKLDTTSNALPDVRRHA